MTRSLYGDNMYIVNVKPDSDLRTQFRKSVETIECRLSSMLSRSSVNSPEWVGTVNCIDNRSKCGLSSKAGLTDREDAEFYGNSDTVDTHDSLPLERAELESLCREVKDRKDIYESIC
ncbi:MAG: hypothetical protein K9L56_14415 [Clostridiales bacterium]|nr:hypothetical protein [Clostridiales bacterium]